MPKVSLLDWRRLDGICRYSVVRLRDHALLFSEATDLLRRNTVDKCCGMSTGTWYYCNKMKTPRADFSAFAYDGKIYCPGGRTTNGALTRAHGVVRADHEQLVPRESSASSLRRVCVHLPGAALHGDISWWRCPQSKRFISLLFNHIWRFGFLKSTNPYLDYEYLWQALPSGVGVPTSLGVRGHQLVFDSAFNRVYLSALASDRQGR
uniref:RES domain-containing protein n=1 Tax=Macrostomum lignano TaxID=282301 RepID=A0A1I8FR36_9PLAT